MALIVLAVIAKPDARGFGTHEQLGLAPCQLLEMTGVPCPGCGVTTSVTLALQGEPAESLATQPFGLILALAWPLLTLWALVLHLRGADVFQVLDRRKRRWIASAMLLMAASWIYKLATL
ncbi:MAG: hypothetical protein ACI8X5_002980 [Planctomycetota bacterium]|jgi:hypothetical protein